MMPKSQMRFAMRRSELLNERQKANLAEPLALKRWSRCTDKRFTDFANNGVFQQYRLFPTFVCKGHKCQLFSFQVRSSTSSVTILGLMKHGQMRPCSLALFPVSEFVGQDDCSSTPQHLP